MKSLLENGQVIDLYLPIGSVWGTQWGDREVVAHVCLPQDGVDDMPYGA